MNDDVRRMVRPNDPETSWEAAAAQTAGKRAQLQSMLYEYMLARPRTRVQGQPQLEAYRGHTLDELVHVFHAHAASSVRTRVSELVELGWVRVKRTENGEPAKRPSDKGHPSLVWVPIRAGDATGHEPRPRATARQMRAAMTEALRDFDRTGRTPASDHDHWVANMALSADRMAAILRAALAQDV